MTVGELIVHLCSCNNWDADVVIDMIDREYSCFDFHVDPHNPEFVYLCNDCYVGGDDDV